MQLELVVPTAADQAAHYGVVSNPLLWFLQHGLAVRRPPGNRFRRAWGGYRAVNAAFAARAAALACAGAPDGVVMVHDYHLYLVPAMMRALGAERFLLFFAHIPWPAPEAWETLPAVARAELVRGVLGSDLVGFHTWESVRNFLRTCAALGLETDEGRGRVGLDGRSVAVRHFPISVDVEAVRAASRTPTVAAALRTIEPGPHERLIVRVDRADPIKNIPRGFRAFGQLLRDHPAWRGRVRFLALVQPTRPDLAEYAAHRAEIEAEAQWVNARFGTACWQPVDLRFVEDLDLALAAYRRYDVLLVNSIADGMNLVAKEGLVCNERDGVLVLSERTGAYEELGAATLGVCPHDVDEQARALHRALTMPAAERRERRLVAAGIVERSDARKWLAHQLGEVERLRPGFRTPRN